jgi:hypothetical protein
LRADRPSAHLLSGGSVLLAVAIVVASLLPSLSLLLRLLLLLLLLLYSFSFYFSFPFFVFVDAAGALLLHWLFSLPSYAPFRLPLIFRGLFGSLFWGPFWGLVRVCDRPRPGSPFTPCAVYLITGGLRLSRRFLYCALGPL